MVTLKQKISKAPKPYDEKEGLNIITIIITIIIVMCIIMPL